MIKRVLKNINQKFISAPVADKGWVLYAFAWSVITRFYILFLPFKYYKKALGVEQTVAQQNLDDKTLLRAKRVSQLVLAVCRHTPWDSKCLVRAIVCKRALKKIGVNTTLYLGTVKSQTENKLEAHAWLKLGETMLTGSRGHKRFNVVNFYG